MPHWRILLRKIPSFSHRARHPHLQPISRIHTVLSLKMNFDQKDVPQQTVKIPRGDISQRHYSKTRKRRVVIVGCSYAGMSATLTLAALKDGLPIPFASYGNYSHLQEAPLAQDFNITIVDERDGFCKLYWLYSDIKLH